MIASSVFEFRGWYIPMTVSSRHKPTQLLALDTVMFKRIPKHPLQTALTYRLHFLT